MHKFSKLLTERDSAVAIGFEVDPNVVGLGLRVEVLHAGGHHSRLYAQGAKVARGVAIRVGRLYHADA